MGRRGPPPKPGPLRLLEGNRGHVKVPSNPEPVALPGPCSEPPEHLNPEAQSVWRSLAPELEAKGLLAPRYMLAFEVFCDAVVQYRRAEKVLAQTGPLVQGHRGVVVSNPASREFSRYAAIMLVYGREFGFTPASVTAIARGASERPAEGSPARLLG